MSTPIGPTSLTGARTLTAMAFRRDRIMLVVWIYALTAFVASTVYGFKKLYPTAAGRDEFVAAAGHNPALLSLYGPLYGNSLGSLTAWRDGALLGLGAGLMSIFLVVRHTRGDEEAGRLELIGAAAVGLARRPGQRDHRRGHGEPRDRRDDDGGGDRARAARDRRPGDGRRSRRLRAGLRRGGRHHRAARAERPHGARAGDRGGRGGVLAAGGRGLGGRDGAALAQLAVPDRLGRLDRAFGSIRWWVLLLPLAIAVVAATAGGLLAARRDYDAGFIAQRPGPAAGAASLRSPLALAWRLQRGPLAGWLAGALVYGTVVGSSAKGIGGLLGSAQVKKIVISLGGQTALTDAYLAAILGFTGLLAAGYAIATVLRLRAEEIDGHADPVLATGTSRVAWGGAHLVIAAAGTTLIVVAAGLGAGLGFTYRSGGGGGEVLRLLLAGLAQAPAALVVGGLAALLFGFLPRLSVPVSWSVLGVVVAMLLLGATVGLSHWVLDLSPFTHLPKLPGGPVTALPLVLLSVIAVLLGVAGLAGLRHRDLE